MSNASEQMVAAEMIVAANLAVAVLAKQPAQENWKKDITATVAMWKLIYDEIKSADSA